MTDMGIHPDDLRALEATVGSLRSDWLKLALTLAYVLGKRRTALEIETTVYPPLREIE